METSKAEELSEKIEELKRQLQEQEDEANDVIARWEESCAACEERCSQLEKELEKMSARHNLLEAEIKETPSGSEGEQFFRSTEEGESFILSTETGNAIDALKTHDEVVMDWQGKNCFLNRLSCAKTIKRLTSISRQRQRFEVESASTGKPTTRTAARVQQSYHEMARELLGDRN